MRSRIGNGSEKERASPPERKKKSRTFDPWSSRKDKERTDPLTRVERKGGNVAQEWDIHQEKRSPFTYFQSRGSKEGPEEGREESSLPSEGESQFSARAR